MTSTLDTPPSPEAAARAAIDQAATWERRAYYTPRLRAKAATALARVHQALEGYGVDEQIRERQRAARSGRDPFAVEVLEAIVCVQNEQSKKIDMSDSDKTDLLNWIVAHLTGELGPDVTLLEPPTIIGPDPTDPKNSIRAIGRAYMVLSRLPSTPPWGRDGDAPLIVALNRTDGSTDPRYPWAWDIYPDAAQGGTGEIVSVIAHAPCLDVATEVATLVAQVLRGEHLLHA